PALRACRRHRATPAPSGISVEYRPNQHLREIHRRTSRHQQDADLPPRRMNRISEQIPDSQVSSNSDFVGRIPKYGDDPTGFPIRVDERRPVEAIAALPTDRKRGIGLLDMDCFELAVSGEPCGQLIRAVEQPCITGVS